MLVETKRRLANSPALRDTNGKAMPDIFDEISNQSRDIFDDIEAESIPGPTEDTELRQRSRRRSDLMDELATAREENPIARAATDFFQWASEPQIPREMFAPTPEEFSTLSPREQGISEALTDVAASFTTPPNIALGAVMPGVGAAGTAGRIAARGASGMFAYEMGRETGNLAQEAGRASALDDPRERARAYTQLGLNTLFTVAAGAHAASGRPPLTKEETALQRAIEQGDRLDPEQLAYVDLAVKNQAATGTVRPQEQQMWSQPVVEPPTDMVKFASPVFERQGIFTGEIQPIKYTDPQMLPEPLTFPKVELETRGKVSFGAESPTLLRTAIELPPEIRQAESAGLTRSAAAARAKVEQQALEPAPIPERRTADAQQNREATEVHGPVREQPIEGQRQVPTEEGGTGVRPQGQDQVLLSDIRRYSELDAEIATLRSGRNAIEAMSDPRMMEVMREQQQIKNRHGGHKPQDIVPIDPAVAELRDLPGTSTTQEAMAIGARVAPESRAQLEELVRTSADEANKVIAEVDAIPNPTEADLSRMSVAGNRAQLMSEALEASRGGKPAMLERQEVIPDAQKEVQTQGPDVLTESGGVAAAVTADKRKNRLDLILDEVERSGEVTIHLEDVATREQVNRVTEASKARGLTASFDGRNFLIRKKQSANAPTPRPAETTPKSESTVAEGISSPAIAGAPKAAVSNVGSSTQQMPSLFRQASAADVDSYVNLATSATVPFGIPEIYVSTNRELALGQGTNKSGIIVEFDPVGLDVREPRQQKPGSKFVEEQGGGGERVIRAQAPQLRNNVRSITIPNGKSKDPSVIRLRRFLQSAWEAEKIEGATVYRPQTKPLEAPQGSAAAAAKVIADKLREQFKTPETGAELGTFGVVPKVINAAVELAAQVIEKGGSAIDGINEAVAYIRKNHTGYFNEQEFRSFAQRAVTPSKPEVAGTGGQGVSGAGDLPARSVQGNQMRKSAQRATTSPDIPEPVQERVAAAPESRYEPQSMRAVEESVARMSEGELAAVARESDLYTASRLELAQRRFKAGDNEGGYKVFEELEKEGTRFGQLINQFKLLAGTQPENIVRVVNEKLTRSGKDRLTPAQEAKMLETSRRSKASDAALDKATQEWVNNPTAENARAAEAQLDAANLSALELQQLVNKFQPKTLPGTLKSILQGNLLTPISEVANLVGNTSFLPFRAATRGSAAFIDMVDAAIRGKPREISAQPLSGTIQAARGAVRVLKEIPSILKEGTGNVIKGETRAGLHPIKAWVNQFAKNPDMPTTGGRLSLGDRLNLALEGTFGIPAEIMLRGLGAGDAPFRKAAEARVITEQLKLAGVPRAQWDFAQKFPELFFDRAKLEQIRNDAAGAIFQGRSSSLDTLNRFIRNNWLTQRGVSPDWIDLAVSTVAPYRLTPWKITGEILSYNPIVAMGRTLFEAKKGNSRSAKLNAGKFVIGSMLTGGAYWLYNKGLLAPSMDERSEAQKARVLAGEILPPNHINVSGLKRALEGGDPAFRKGDETVDVFRGGGLAGAMMYLVANIGREFERKPEEAQSDMFGSILRQSTLEQARFAMNQSYLSGVEGLLTAIKDGNTDNWFRQWSGTLLSIPLPNTLSTLSRATRQYKPDVKSDTFKKGVENIVRTRLGFAGLDDYMPLKRGLWGEPLPETPKDRNAFFYHFFDISKNKQVTDDPVPLELYRLWRRTGDTKAIPSLPEKRMTVASRNYPLTPELQSRYAELIGAERRRIVDRLVVNPFFQSRNDEQKIKILDRAYREGHERGKVMFWRENGDKLTAAPDKAGF